MKDRFTIGFLSGIIAGIPTHLFNWGGYYLQITTLRWVDIMGILVYGKKPDTLGETLLGVVWVYFFLGVLGIVFAFIMTKVSSKNYILKALVFSIFISLVVHVVPQLFKIPELLHIPAKTSLSNFMGATLWGLSLGYALNWFSNRRIKTKQEQ